MGVPSLSRFGATAVALAVFLIGPGAARAEPRPTEGGLWSFDPADEDTEVAPEVAPTNEYETEAQALAAASEMGTDERRDVVVTGTRTERSRRDAPIATQVYDRQEIIDSGGENLAEVLQETPGLVVQRGLFGSGVQMQGLDPAYTAVLIDGQRTTGRVGGVMDLSRFPAEEIERVEIVRGPSSVLYGADALAGTINLITRRPNKRHEGEAHFAYGSFDTLDLTGRVGMSRRRYSGSLLGGWHRTAGWDADPSNLSTTGPRSSQLNLATTQEVGAFGPLTLWSRASYLRRDSLLVDETGTGAVFDRQNRSEVIQATVRPTLEDGPTKLTVTTSYNLWRDQFLADQRGTSELDQSQDTFDHIGQVLMQYDHAIGDHAITAGTDMQLELLTTDRIDPSTVDRQRYALFVQDEWVPSKTPRISIFPGFRLDYDTFFGIYPTPRIATMIVPNEKWTIRASYGRGYRAPSFREMFLRFVNAGVGYTVQGNAGLRPETSWSASISGEYRPWKWMWFAANVFDNRLQDTIVTDTRDPTDVDTATLFEYVNIGEATTRGVESQAAVTILERLTVDGSYTFVHTRNHATGQPLPGRPRHSGTAGLRYHRPASGTTVRLRSSIIGQRSFFTDTDDDDIEEEVRSPAFATLDLRASQTIFVYAQLFLGIENLLDAGNATDNPLQPRTYYGGVTIRY